MTEAQHLHEEKKYLRDLPRERLLVLIDARLTDYQVALTKEEHAREQVNLMRRRLSELSRSRHELHEFVSLAQQELSRRK